MERPVGRAGVTVKLSTMLDTVGSVITSSFDFTVTDAGEYEKPVGSSIVHPDRSMSPNTPWLQVRFATPV